MDGKSGLFLSTPSARRATTAAGLARPSSRISIHALCEEGDAASFAAPLLRIVFLSTPSARRATEDEQTLLCYGLFLSTPSARRATFLSGACFPSQGNFYPRPLRGGRHNSLVTKYGLAIFLSTPSARRATLAERIFLAPDSISIHALCEEGDPAVPATRSASNYFYPRPLRGGRHAILQEKRRIMQISIHALCEEGDPVAIGVDVQGVVISIHALCEEGDHVIRPPVSYHFSFLSTPSARRATITMVSLMTVT